MAYGIGCVDAYNERLPRKRKWTKREVYLFYE